MGIFAELFKLSLDKKKKYIDVTDSFEIDLFYKIKNRILVDTNIELHICKSEDDFAHLKIYSTQEMTADKINFSLRNSQDNTHITIEYKNEIRNCYIVLYLPWICSLDVISSNADIIIEKCSIDSCFVKTRGGDIIIRELLFKIVKCVTVSGDISMLIDNAPVKYKLHSKYGEKVVEKVKNCHNSSREIKCVSEDGDILLKNIE